MDKNICDIKKHLGILSTQKSGWNTELNLISWYEKEPKYDIRSWDENHEKMSKGITLNKEELIKLVEIIKNMDDVEEENNDLFSTDNI